MKKNLLFVGEIEGIGKLLVDYTATQDTNVIGDGLRSTEVEEFTVESIESVKLVIDNGAHLLEINAGFILKLISKIQDILNDNPEMFYNDEILAENNY